MSIKTTHVGSLPRTQKVVDYIFARENKTPFSQNDFDSAMSEAVQETVEKQVKAGINIVSDGETSKISYATYVKDRYTGFDGDSPPHARPKRAQTSSPYSRRLKVHVFASLCCSQKPLASAEEAKHCTESAASTTCAAVHAPAQGR